MSLHDWTTSILKPSVYKLGNLLNWPARTANTFITRVALAGTALRALADKQWGAGYLQVHDIG